MKNKYEIRGDVTAIFINRKDRTILEALIDTNDLEKVSEFKGMWGVVKEVGKESYYVTGFFRIDTNNWKHIYLHRYLFDLYEKGIYVDHINNIKLDNRRSVNLRLATHQQNHENIVNAHATSKTGIRGVHWSKAAGKWTARIKINGVGKHIGTFDDILEAEKAVKEARAKYMPFSQEALKVIRGELEDGTVLI